MIFIKIFKGSFKDKHFLMITEDIAAFLVSMLNKSNLMAPRWPKLNNSSNTKKYGVSYNV